MLNRLVDDIVHPRGAPKDIGSIVVDEALHTIIEGEFRLDKFIRYTVMPALRGNTRRSKLRRRKPRKDETLLFLP